MSDAFFGEPFRRLFFSASAPMDWLETSSAHIIRINVPGLGRDEIKVQLEEGNTLHIRGEAKEEGEGEREKEAVWHVMGRGRADFERTLGLPDNIKAEQIKAHVHNGVLTVVLPKERVAARPKARSIPVSSRL